MFICLCVCVYLNICVCLCFCMGFFCVCASVFACVKGLSVFLCVFMFIIFTYVCVHFRVVVEQSCLHHNPRKYSWTSSVKVHVGHNLVLSSKVLVHFSPLGRTFQRSLYALYFHESFCECYWSSEGAPLHTPPTCCSHDSTHPRYTDTRNHSLPLVLIPLCYWPSTHSHDAVWSLLYLSAHNQLNITLYGASPSAGVPTLSATILAWLHQ